MKNHELLSAAFLALSDNSKNMMFVKDINGVYQTASLPFVRMVGKESAEEIIGKTDLEIFEDSSLAERYVTDDHKLLAEGKDLINYIEPITDDNGQHRYGSTSKYILKDELGEAIGILGITRDITRDYLARQHYQQELKYLFELPQDTYAVSYIDIDGWRIISQRKQLIGESTLQTCHTVESLCEAAVESIVDDKNEAAEFYRNFNPEYLRDLFIKGRSIFSFTYQRRMPDGTIRWVHNEVRFLMDVDSGHLCAMLTAKDIDGQKQEEKKLLEAAQLDKMTMVLNRETTMESIGQVLVNEPNQMHALLMIDVDNFKSLNDTLGHQMGDKFLIALAAEIKDSFSESDIVGRVGGDEFFVLMRDVAGIRETEQKAEELLAAILKVGADYPDIPISGSIGIGMYPQNGVSLGQLYAQADSALYRAKRTGKNQYIFA